MHALLHARSGNIVLGPRFQTGAKMLPWKAPSRSENIVKPIDADRLHQNSSSRKLVQLSSHHSRGAAVGPEGISNAFFEILAVDLAVCVITEV